MSSQFLSLEEAAKKLGMPPETLVSMRSEGRIRGFRDGSSWKFAIEELTRFAEEIAQESEAYDPYQMAADDEDEYRLADEDQAESPAVAKGPSKAGIQTPPKAGSGRLELDSDDLELTLESPPLTHDSADLDLADMGKSDSPLGPSKPVGKAPVAGSDSGLAFDSFDDDDEMDSDDELIGLNDDAFEERPAAGKGKQDKAAASSGLDLIDDLDDLTDIGGASGVLSDIDLLGKQTAGSSLISGDSGAGKSGGSAKTPGPGKSGSVGKGSGLKPASGSGRGAKAIDNDDDLLITDNEDELVLGGGSDLSISGDSGINLMSPSDSGISLESEPLDLAGSSISALDLAAELGSGIGSGASGIGSSPGAEDFQLSPSGLNLETDNDSSSQVIEVEDSAAFSEIDPNSLDAAGFGQALDDQEALGEGEPIGEDAMGLDDGFGAEGELPMRSAAPVSTEVPYSVFQVLGLVCILAVLSLGGMLMTDMVRNIWSYSKPEAPVSGLTDWLIDLSPFGS